jgi:ABC-2 type transport system permease protein
MFACVVIALMTAVNVLFTQANLTAAQHVRLFGAGSLLVLPFCALGLAAGASLPVAAAFAFANLGWTGLAMLGGLLFPVPRWLAMWTPTYYAGQLNRAIVGLPTDVPAWISVVVLTALTVIFGSLAINRINAANDD